MKNFARLILFFTLVFIIILAATTCLKYLSLRVEWAKNLPPKPETALTLIIDSARWALTLTMFSVILLTLNYIVRRKIFPFTAIISVIILSVSFCYGITYTLNKMTSVPPAQTAGVQMGEKGLILSNSLNRNVTAIVLLEGTANPHGPRVTAIPGQPLAFYESAAGTDLGLPPIPFGDDTPWFLKSLDIDIRMNAEMYQQKFNEGLSSWLIYVGAFIFILCSLGFLIKFSAWPLANLFLAAIAFRGILALGTFLNTGEIQNVISSFLNNIMLAGLALPLSFVGFGILVYIYSILSFAAKRRKNDGN